MYLKISNANPEKIWKNYYISQKNMNQHSLKYSMQNQRTLYVVGLINIHIWTLGSSIPFLAACYGKMSLENKFIYLIGATF